MLKINMCSHCLKKLKKEKGNRYSDYCYVYSGKSQIKNKKN